MSETVGVMLEVGAENTAQAAVDQVAAQMAAGMSAADRFSESLGALNAMAMRADSSLANLNTHLGSLSSSFSQGTGPVETYTSALDQQMATVTDLTGAYDRLAYSRRMASDAGAGSFASAGSAPPAAAAAAAASVSPTMSPISGRSYSAPPPPSFSAPSMGNSYVPPNTPGGSLGSAPPPYTGGYGFGAPGAGAGLGGGYAPPNYGNGAPPLNFTGAPNQFAGGFAGTPGGYYNSFNTPWGQTPNGQAASAAQQQAYQASANAASILNGMGGGSGGGSIPPPSGGGAYSGGFGMSPPIGGVYNNGTGGGGGNFYSNLRGAAGGFGRGAAGAIIGGANNLSNKLGGSMMARFAGYYAMGAGIRGVHSMLQAGYQLSAAESSTQAMTGASGADMQALIANTQAGGASGNDPYSELQQINLAYPLMSVGLDAKLSQQIGNTVMQGSAAAGETDALGTSTSLMQALSGFGLRSGNDASIQKNARLVMNQMMVATQLGPYTLPQTLSDVGAYAPQAHNMSISAGDSMAYLGLEGLGGTPAGQISDDYRSFLDSFTHKITAPQQLAARAIGLHMDANTISRAGGLEGFTKLINQDLQGVNDGDKATFLSGLFGNQAAQKGFQAVMSELPTGRLDAMFGGMAQQQALSGTKKDATQKAYDIFQNSDAGKLKDASASLATSFENLGKAMLPLETAFANAGAVIADTASKLVQHPGEVMGSIGNYAKESLLHPLDQNLAQINAIKDTYYHADTMDKLHAKGDQLNSQGFWGTTDSGGNFTLDRYQGTAASLAAAHAATLHASDDILQNGVWGKMVAGPGRFGNIRSFQADAAQGVDVPAGASLSPTDDRYNPGRHLYAHQVGMTSAADASALSSYHYGHEAGNDAPLPGESPAQTAARIDAIHQFDLGQTSGIRTQNYITTDKTNIRTAISSGNAADMQATLAALITDMANNGATDKQQKMYGDQETLLVQKALLKDQKLNAGYQISTDQLAYQQAGANNADPAVLRADYMKTLDDQRAQNMYKLAHNEIDQAGATLANQQIASQRSAYDKSAGIAAQTLASTDAYNASQIRLRADTLNNPMDLARQRADFMAGNRIQQDQNYSQFVNGTIKRGQFDNTAATLKLDAQAYDKTAADNAQKLASSEQLTAAQLQVQAAQAMHESPALIRAAFMAQVAIERGQTAYQLKTHQIDGPTATNQNRATDLSVLAFNNNTSTNGLSAQQTALQENLDLANKSGVNLQQAQDALQAFDTKYATQFGYDAGFLRNQAYDFNQNITPKQIVKYIRPTLPNDDLSANFGGSAARLDSGGRTMHDQNSQMIALLQEQVNYWKHKALADAVLLSTAQNAEREAVKQSKLQKSIADNTTKTSEPARGNPLSGAVKIRR